MKFPVNCNAKFFNAERDTINGIVHTKSNAFIGALFLMDTGCPYTFLSPIDIKKARIRIGSGEFFQTINISKLNLNLYDFGWNAFSFRNENGELSKIEQKIYGCTLPNGVSLNTYLPSFLGKDFLDKCTITKKNQDGIKFLDIDL